MTDTSMPSSPTPAASSLAQRLGLIGLWALNVALYAVLVAAGGESVLHLSPLWPVILGTVIIYGVLVGLLWRKTDVTLQCEASVAVLAGLLAYSGWRTGSLAAPGGVKIFGQSADVAAAVLLVFILASVAITVASVRQLPWWVRAIIACIVLYAAVPLAYTLRHGSGLLAALSTNAPFPTEPFWIRGAFIGASILLPLAGAAALVGAGVLAARRRGGAALRLAGGALALVLAAQMSGLEAVKQGLPSLASLERGAAQQVAQGQIAPTSQPPQGGQSAQTDAAQLNVALTIPSSGDYQAATTAVLSAAAPGPAVPLDQMATQFDQVVRSIPADAYDVDQRAKEVPSDVNSIFTFVRDQIRFESYRGVLRAASGTYTARAGNALDRSLLLAHILKAKNMPVRFAAGTLAAADAARLYDRIFELPVHAAGATSAPLPTTADAAALENRIYARAKRDYAVVRSALGNQLPDATIMSRDDVIKEIQSHTWVQAQVNGSWEDLDTAFPDATPGKAYCTADKTFDTPTDDMMQQVTIRVTTESLASGALTTATPLEVRLPAYQRLDQQIFVTHSPPGVKGLVGAKDTLVPILVVAGETTEGKPIAFGDAASSQGKFGAVNDLFGTAAPSASASTFVAERLEFEIDFPDGHKEVSRRVLIDRAGAAWRASTSHDPAALKPLQRDAQGVPLAAEAIYNVWFSAGGHDMREYARALQSLLQSFGPPDASGAPPALSFGQQFWPIAMRDFAWVAWSDRVAIPSLNDSPNLRFYVDSPKIFVFGFGPDPQGRANTFFSESDLRRDTVRGLARDGSANAALIEHKLWFGTLEGSLEHEMSATDAARADGKVTMTSTSGLLTSDGVVVMRPGSNPGSLTADKNTAARMATALAAGDTLVVPRPVLQGGQSGWWQIAHSGADMRGVLGDDLNSASYGGSPFPPSANQMIRANPGAVQGPMGAPQSKGCGSEYSCLLAVITATGGVAYWTLGIIDVAAWTYVVKVIVAAVGSL